MNLKTFIEENREMIDAMIRKQVPNAKIDDAERRMWVMNDEGLYLWAKSEGCRI